MKAYDRRNLAILLNENKDCLLRFHGRPGVCGLKLIWLLSGKYSQWLNSVNKKKEAAE